MIEWLAASDNDDGIDTIALETISEKHKLYKTVGYNNILKGDKVTHEGKEYTVVMVSRLGDFGLSETGALPYTLRVSPKSVEKSGAAI